jgi:hypothetical protein
MRVNIRFNEGTRMNLKSMSIDRLFGLRDQVSAALGAKVIDERRALESELSKLTRFQGGRSTGKVGDGARWWIRRPEIS